LLTGSLGGTLLVWELPQQLVFQAIAGIVFTPHQEFSTVRSSLVSLVQVFHDRFKAESGWNWCHPDSAWKRSSKTCMKITGAECTVENS